MGEKEMTRQPKSYSKIRYAVVGLGHIAQVAVLPAFKNSKNSELVAIVSGESEKREKLGKKYRLEHVYSYEDYDRALSEVDAVYIAVPNHLHREYTVRAAKAGVHVLCEKPMAVSEEECKAMLDAAEQDQVKLMIAYRLHFEAGNLEAIRLAESGKLGKLRVFSSEFAHKSPRTMSVSPKARNVEAGRFTIWEFIASTPLAIFSVLNQLKSLPRQLMMERRGSKMLKR
jgi:predicted dehydrogenase